MARKPRPKRRERRQRSNKVLRRLGIALVIALPLLYFAFTQVFFDPFEGSQPVFSVLVPRDVGLYVRRERLDSDLEGLRPRLWDQLKATRAWRDLSGNPWGQTLTWPGEFDALLTGAEEQLAAAPFDVVADLLGREVAVIGRLPADGGETQAALMLRISGRAKLGVELLDFDFALQKALPGASQQTVQDPEAPSIAWRRLDLPEELAPGAGGTWFYARRQDLLVVSRTETLVRDVLRQIESGEETSLGLSRTYHDELPARTAEPEEKLSLEFVVDARPLVARLGLTGPPAVPGPDALTNALPRLLDPTLLGELAGRLEVDDRLLLRASADLGEPRAGSPDAGVRGAPAFVLRDRLRDVLGLLPADTTAVLTLNASLRPLLETVTASLGPEEVKLLNDTIRDVSRFSPSWRVDSLPALIAYLDRALGDEVSIALRPRDHETPSGLQPLPAMAFLFSVQDDALFQAFIDAVVRGYKALGIDPEQMKQVGEGVGTRKWLGVSGLPMSEFSCIVLDGETAIIGTDDDFVREIVAVYTNQRSSVAGKPGVRALLDGFDSHEYANVAAWADAEGLLDLLEPYAAWVADMDTIVDLGALRLTKGRELLDTPRFREWKDKEALLLAPVVETRSSDPAPRAEVPGVPLDVRKAFDDELSKIMAAVEEERQTVTIPRLASEWRARQQWLSLLRQFAFGLRVGTHEAKLAVLAGTALQR